MLLFLTVIVGLAVGYIYGCVVGERAQKIADAELVAIANERARAAEFMQTTIRGEYSQMAANAREDADKQTRRAFEAAATITGEARATIEQSRKALNEAVEITRKAVGLLFPPDGTADADPPPSVAEADRDTARRRAQDRTLRENRMEGQ